MDKKKEDIGKKVEIGFIFRDKYAKSPNDLSFEEINEFVFGKRKVNVVNIDTSIVSPRGNVFEIKDYNIDEQFEKELDKEFSF